MTLRVKWIHRANRIMYEDKRVGKISRESY